MHLFQAQWSRTRGLICLHACVSWRRCPPKEGRSQLPTPILIHRLLPRAITRVQTTTASTAATSGKPKNTLAEENWPPKTTFSIDQGFWQLWVLPFGLCNGPATFERLMERILAGVLRNRSARSLKAKLACGCIQKSVICSGQRQLSWAMWAVQRAVELPGASVMCGCVPAWEKTALLHSTGSGLCLLRLLCWHFPYLQRSFILDTDASDVEVLSQERGQAEH